MLSICCLLILGSSCVPVQPWAKAPGFTRFVELVDADGAAYQVSDKVVYLDAKGKVVRRVGGLKGSWALYDSATDGLVCAPHGLLSCRKPTEKAPKPYGIRCYAQGENIFLVGTGIIYMGLGAVSGFTAPAAMDNYSIAVDRGGNRLVLWTEKEERAAIQIYNNTAGEWCIEPKEISPRIEGLGSCLLYMPRSDVRFARSDVVIYLGQIAYFNGLGRDNWDEFSKGLEDWSQFPLSKTAGMGSQVGVALFATNLKSGRTVGIARFKTWSTGEGGAAMYGRMTISRDRLYLYIEADEKIIRLPIEAMLKRAAI